jgi:hypothetical protein
MLLKPLDPADDGAGGALNSGGNAGAAGNSKGGHSASGAVTGGGTGGAPTSYGGIPSAGGTLAGTGGAEPTAGDGGAGSPQGGAPNPSCGSNADCNQDSPSFCDPAELRCMPLISPECRVLVGDPKKAQAILADPQALYFGAFAPFSESDEANTIRDTYALALQEFQQVHGLPSRTGEPRPLVMVLCNSEGGAEVIDAGMRHLIENVHVPAVLAAIRSDDLQRNFQSDYGNRTFYLSPQKVSDELAAADTAGLVWSLLGRSANLAPVYAATVRQFETNFQNAPGGERPLHVAVVVEFDNPDENELWNAVSTSLRFNEGASLTDNVSAGNALVVEATSATAINQIAAFVPDLVLSFAGDIYTQRSGIAQGIDRFVAPRPYHLLSPFNSGDVRGLREVFADEAVQIKNPQQRFFGIDGPSALDAGSKDARNLYLVNLLAQHPSDRENFENFYDAVYYIAYAMLAGDQPLTGPGVANGMLRLYQGTELAYVGPASVDGSNNITTTCTKILTAKSIKLMGTLGAPNFDATGSRIDTGSLYCFDNLPTPTLRASVIGYDPESDALFVNSSPMPCLSTFVTASAGTTQN